MGLDRPGITPTRKKVKRKALPRSAASVPDRVVDSRAKPKAIPRGALAGAVAGSTGAKVKPRKTTRARSPGAVLVGDSKRKGLLDEIGDVAGDSLRAVYGGPAKKGAKGAPRTAAAQSRGLLISPSVTAGAGRVISHTTKAVAKKVYEDPVDSTIKSARQAGEIAKGVASAAIGLPIYTVNYGANKALGRDPKGDEPLKIATRIVNAEGRRLSDSYGPSFRGEKGASKRLERKVDESGPLIPALDLATIASPVSAGLGATTRKVASVRAAKGAKPGVVGKLVNRPDVRVTPLGPATKREPRKGAVSQVASVGRDTVRRGAQKATVARHKKTGKPLPARRALLKPGEITPISPLSGSGRHTSRTGSVNRALRVSTAKPIRQAEYVAERRVASQVTDTSKHSTSVRAGFKGLPEPLHHAALTAAQLGVKDAAGARAIILRRIAEIERTVAQARAKKSHPAHAAASRDDSHLDELAKLRSYLANPAPLLRADVQKAADAVRTPRIGPREGLGPDRAAVGRTGLVGGTLGVKTAKEVNDAARIVRRREQAVAKRAVVKTRDARVKAEADLRVARAKGDPAAIVAADAALAAARATAKAARDARKAVRGAAPVVRESGVSQAARVDAVVAKLGLLPPAHIRSTFKRDEGLLRTQHEITGEANPLGRERKGTLYTTGREDKSLRVVEAATTGAIRKGARMEGRSQVIAEHAKTFPSEKAANAWATKHGLNTTETGDMVIAPIPDGMARKGLVTPRVKKSGRPDPKADAGDYVKTRDVILMPKVAYREMMDLNEFAKRPPNAFKRTLAGSQAALLALNPSWWQFQRVNDAVAATLGGSAQHTAVLEKLRRELRRTDPDAYENLAVMAGGSMSREMLTPHTAQNVGRLKRILDENPTYRDALHSDTPATALLLRGAKNVPTMLLRSDQAITGAFRERQLLHNLRQVARRMDPDVSAVARAFDPIGQAFKTGDVNTISKLLKDPAYQRELGAATDRLNKVMGDWHHYTARELNLKQYAAFYGFLRYSTRLALFTLPLDHPALGLLIARLGEMGSQDAKNIIGPDMPYGLGSLYNADGTIAADFARANPLTGPLLNITKPEQIIGLSTPLASIALSTALGQSIGLSDSSQGYVKQMAVEGDPKDTSISAADRSQILLAQVARMLGPVSEWQRWDSRMQTDDSLPWRREISREPPGSDAALRLARKNAGRVGGLEGLAHNTLPLLFPSSSRNQALQGQTVTAARNQARIKEAKRKVRRAGGSTSSGGGSSGGLFDTPASSGSGLFDTPSSGASGLFGP